jgi:23S rRNA (uracil1939-C5)-methyltransferase
MDTLTIERMTYGIDSLGRLDGKVVFIPYAVPQDVVEFEISETKADFLRGKLQKVVTPSPLRQASPCPNFPACGGCHWLHLNLEAQLREKEAFLRHAFKPLAPKTVYPLEPLPDTDYRNKMELKIGRSPEGALILGNYRYHSHEVVSLAGCRVQVPQNRVMYDALYRLLSQPQHASLADTIETITVRTLGEQQHTQIEMRQPPANELLEVLRAFFHEQPDLSRLEVTQGHQSLLTVMREKPAFQFMKRPWFVSARSFFQNNLDGAESILHTLMTIYSASPQKGKLVDLYCGCGVQSLLLANRFEEVFAIEANDDSYQDALKNLKMRGSTNVRFLHRRAETIFPSTITKGVIAALHVNPPRTGLSTKVLRGLAGIKPKVITYLSCNPMTFRRDAQAILQMGFSLDRVHTFDLFPGTYHVEVLGVFTR